MTGALPFLRRAVLHALLAAAVACGGASELVAGPEDGALDTPESLRQELLAHATPGAWEATMRTLLDRPPADAAAILAPVFLREEFAQRADVVRYVAGYLVAHPLAEGGGTRVLLSDLILERARGPDLAQYLAAVRDQQLVDRRLGRAPNWERLLLHARDALLPPKGPGVGTPAPPAPPLAVRLGALAVISWDPGAEWRRTVGWLLELGAELLGGDERGADQEAVGSALLEALQRLTGYRFGTLREAVSDVPQVLAGARSHVELVLAYSNRKDDSDRSRRLAVAYGRDVIRRLENAAALTRAIEDDTYPFPELRRALLDRAGDLKPKPGNGWDAFFERIFERVSEPDVVLAALDLLAAAGFGAGQDDCCPTVAAALQRRLSVRKPPDGPEVRVRLVRALGDLASFAPLEAQVELVLARGTVAVEESPEIAELVLAVGRSARARVGVLLHPFYVLSGLAPEVREALRVAVARALGRAGLRKGDAPAAVTALKAILDGPGEGAAPAFERAVSPAVRETALRSLAAHGGAETANYLLGKALAEPGTAPVGPGEPRVALESLVEMAAQPGGGEEAAQAYVAFLTAAQARAGMDERRALALRRAPDVVAVEHLGAATRAAVVAAVRAALSPPGGEDVRWAALRASTELSDPEALAPATQWFGEQLAGVRAQAARDAVRALFEAVVRRAATRDPKTPGLPESDERVEQELGRVAVLPGQGALAHEWAEALARLGARSGAPRPALLLAQARTLLLRSAGAEVTPAQRQEDASAARALLVAALPAAQAASATPGRPPHLADRVRGALVEALGVLAALQGESPAAAAHLLEAVRVAAKASDQGVLRAGAAQGRRLALSEPLRASLSAADVLEFERLQQQLEQAPEPGR